MSASQTPTQTSHAPYTERLNRLRKALNSRGVDAIIIPSADPHQSEYVAEPFAARSYFSGFTGSAGVLVVTTDAQSAPGGGGLFTDSRYYVDAPRQLARTSGIPMVRALQGGDTYTEWLIEHLPAGSSVGIDGSLFTVAQVRRLHKTLAAADLKLVTDVDVLPEAWTDRPALPSTPMFGHDVKFAGKSASDKISELRTDMVKAKVSHTFLSALDEIAWLLNIRASDIHCNPLAIAYALVGPDSVTLFTEADRIGKEVLAGFSESGITVQPYAAYEASLRDLKPSARVGIDENQINNYIAELLAKEQRVAFASPIRLAKAIKNETEIGHIREAHAKDGAALVRAFMWLEKTLAERTVRECEFVEVLANERAKGDHFYGPSFDSIVAYAANAALPHYHPSPGHDAEIKRSGILLVDSGGQYHDGTTDITRTVALGDDITDVQRKRYTQVLRGHIALARAVFPSGTRGAQLDTFARQYLWADGVDFGHGTGHGVGFFLNVHEPPQGFAPSLTERGKTGHVAGMFSSNEPGYYEEGEYGIRIENLILAKEAFPERAAVEGETRFLRFEDITYFPIDTSLANIDELLEEERVWLNAYHEVVVQRLSPKLDEAQQAWLKGKCAPV